MVISVRWWHHSLAVIFKWKFRDTKAPAPHLIDTRSNKNKKKIEREKKTQHINDRAREPYAQEEIQNTITAAKTTTKILDTNPTEFKWKFMGGNGWPISALPHWASNQLRHIFAMLLANMVMVLGWKMVLLVRDTQKRSLHK